MSLSKTTLAAIQQAGQALHQATVVVTQAVRDQAEHVVSTVASQPFEAEGEQAFANFRQLARLSQDLQALEVQLRTLYTEAAELARPEMDVVAALPPGKQGPLPDSSKDLAEDVVPKPAPAREATSRRRRAPASPAAALTPNDRRLLDYLAKALQTKGWTALTTAAMAQGAGLPLGSVGVSLRRLVASGAVRKNDKGSYQRRA